MSLPDNVTAKTEYVVHSTDTADALDAITVVLDDVGHVRVKQDSDLVLIAPADVPGLIAALRAVAGGVPAPQGPATVIDNDGDVWDRNPDGTYICDAAVDVAHSLDQVRADYGIREEHA